jgi:transcriptional regulator with XRE-family HTH domain
LFVVNDAGAVVGDRIRQLRASKKLLQRDLARDAGVPVRTIGRIERGEVDVRLSTLTKIARALGMSLALLVEESPRPSSIGKPVRGRSTR